MAVKCVTILQVYFEADSLFYFSIPLTFEAVFWALGDVEAALNIKIVFSDFFSIG